MSDKIDWSKAPEWATKHGLSGAFKSQVWFDDKKYTYVDGQQDGKEFFYADACTYAAKDFSQVSERPAAPSWSGEGLPPVGVVCEVKLQEEWSLCEIIAHFQQPQAMVAAFTVAQFHGGKKLDSKIAECFRPIRTPEQIAADEREVAIQDISQIINKNLANTMAAAAIYDSGYRKP